MPRRNHPPRYWLLATTCLIIVGIGFYAAWRYYQVDYENAAVVSKDSGLRLVLPKPLPDGSSVTHHPSYDKKSLTVTTSIKVRGSDITFSQQKRPETDLEQIDTEETFLVNAGPVYVLKGEKGHLQAIVQTADSWIMVNAEAKFGVSNFKSLLETLGTISS